MVYQLFYIQLKIISWFIVLFVHTIQELNWTKSELYTDPLYTTIQQLVFNSLIWYLIMWLPTVSNKYYSISNNITGNFTRCAI